MEEKLKKISKRLNGNLYFALVFLIIAIVLFVVGYLKTDSVDLPKLYDVTDEYVAASVNTKFVPYVFAEFSDNDDDPKLYFIMDEDNYLFIVYMTNEQYEDLLKQDEALEENPAVLQGKSYIITEDIKDIAIEVYAEDFESDFITDDNFYEYFGYYYLDMTNYNGFSLKTVFYILGSVMLLFAICFGAVYFVDKRKFNSIKNNIGSSVFDKVAKEVENAKLAYENAGIYLTDNYLVSVFNSLTIVEYKDIVWFYKIEMGQGNNSTKSITIYDKNKTKYVIDSFNKLGAKSNEAFKKVLDLLDEKCPAALVGYSKESRKSAQELYNIK